MEFGVRGLVERSRTEVAPQGNDANPEAGRGSESVAQALCILLRCMHKGISLSVEHEADSFVWKLRSICPLPRQPILDEEFDGCAWGLRAADWQPCDGVTRVRRRRKMLTNNESLAVLHRSCRDVVQHKHVSTTGRAQLAHGTRLSPPQAWSATFARAPQSTRMRAASPAPVAVPQPEWEALAGRLHDTLNEFAAAVAVARLRTIFVDSGAVDSDVEPRAEPATGSSSGRKRMTGTKTAGDRLGGRPSLANGDLRLELRVA